ncbi:MAG: hypothetical protein K0R90_422 [Oscillospiraceae bacterium]|jgi:hypothetical protein|nr:hypothetical protein [Oscillospiraceae bacterium]
MNEGINKIILIGDMNDTLLKNKIVKEFSKFFKVIYTNDKSIFSEGCGHEIFLIEYENFDDIVVDNAAIVLKSKAKISKQNVLSGDSYVIVHSANEKQLSMLTYKNIRAITCGMSNKDTLTFSSKEDEYAISLQRTLKIKDLKIEPLEIVIDCYDMNDDYSILAYAACLILTGVYNFI